MKVLKYNRTIEQFHTHAGVYQKIFYIIDINVVVGTGQMGFGPEENFISRHIEFKIETDKIFTNIDEYKTEKLKLIEKGNDFAIYVGDAKIIEIDDNIINSTINTLDEYTTKKQEIVELMKNFI